MSLTMPQILMLGHASRVNYARMQERSERQRKADDIKRERDRRDPRTANGKRMSELTMDELLPVLMGGGAQEE